MFCLDLALLSRLVIQRWWCTHCRYAEKNAWNVACFQGHLEQILVSVPLALVSLLSLLIKDHILAYVHHSVGTRYNFYIQLFEFQTAEYSSSARVQLQLAGSRSRILITSWVSFQSQQPQQFLSYVAHNDQRHVTFLWAAMDVCCACCVERWTR